MRALTTDLERADLRPYFLWDEDVSIAELREALAHGDPWMLREARDIDVRDAECALGRGLRGTSARACGAGLRGQGSTCHMAGCNASAEP
jgi:hypothetical protein